MTTKECKFKVGETYKDRSGSSWILVARNDQWKKSLVFRGVSDGYCSTRTIDGRYDFDRECNADILPNKRKEWVVTYNEGPYATVAVCTSEYAAKDRVLGMVEANARREKHGNRPLYTNIRGPMLWEYEE